MYRILGCDALRKLTARATDVWATAGTTSETVIPSIAHTCFRNRNAPDISGDRVLGTVFMPFPIVRKPSTREVRDEQPALTAEQDGIIMAMGINMAMIIGGCRTCVPGATSSDAKNKGHGVEARRRSLRTLSPDPLRPEPSV